MGSKLFIYSFIVVAISFFSGCTAKQQSSNSSLSKKDVQNDSTSVQNDSVPYKFRLKPIIGSRNSDSRTVVDMGVVMKIWITPYKDKNNNLIASHDIYTWVRKPDFIVGENLPSGTFMQNNNDYDTGGMINIEDKLPFMLSPSEIDRSDIENDEIIQKYANKIYKLQVSEKNAQEQLKKSEDFDAVIKNFVNKNKKKDSDENSK